MPSLATELQKHIKIINFSFREESELREILKRKLTKKEFKLLEGWSFEVSKENLSQSLGYNEIQYNDAMQKLIKKLNQEKTKKEIFVQ